MQRLSSDLTNNFLHILEVLFQFDYQFGLVVKDRRIPGNKFLEIKNKISNLDQVEEYSKASQMLEKVQIQNNDSGDNCLFLAFKHPHPLVIGQLINLMKTQQCLDPNYTNAFHQNMISRFFFHKNQSLEIFQMLIGQGANPNLCDNQF